MPVLSPSSRVLSLSIHQDELEGVVLRKKKGIVSLEGLVSGPLSFPVVKWLDNSPSEPFTSLLKDSLVTVLLGEDAPLLIRSLSVPLTKKTDVERAIPYEIETLFPLSEEETAFDTILFPPEQGTTLVTIAATTKESVRTTLDRFRAWGIEAETVTGAPIALALLSSFLSPCSLCRGVLYQDDREAFFLVTKESRLLGSIKLDTPIQKGPLTRTIGALTRQIASPLIPSILVFGKVDPSVIPEPYQVEKLEGKWGLSLEEFQRSYLLIGTALNSLVGVEGSVDLSQEIDRSLPFNRLKNKFIYLVFSLLLALVTVFGSGEAYIAWKEGEIRQKWASLLSLWGKEEKDFEVLFTEKKGGSSNLNPSSKLSPEAIVQRASFLHQQIENTPLLFPLHPNTPRLSDLLGWLGSLPEVTEGSEKKLEITSLHYTLVRRPEMEKKTEKYQVKIELEFSTHSPKWARQFHDMLIAPNPFVDPKGEIKWSVSRGHYKTSFLLKDQTLYVQ